MSQTPSRRPVGFTPREIRAFKIYALILAAVAGGFAVVAPKGLGQTLGALFAVALLPIPPLVIYWRRRRQSSQELASRGGNEKGGAR